LQLCIWAEFSAAIDKNKRTQIYGKSVKRSTKTPYDAKALFAAEQLSIVA